MSTEQTESDYYAFMRFDRANAESVLSHYLPFFERGPVLELACGPGVFLDLLRDRGVDCRGVDIDDGMVAECVTHGHDVVLGDAVEYLRETPDRSLQGLFAAHFLEHLPAEQVQAVYHQAARVLAPGGTFVAVVPNAACMSVLTFDFWRDPTHVRFYDPLALQFFARQSGLDVVASDGNPRNHPGPPPSLFPFGEPAGADIAELVSQFVGQAQASLARAGERRIGPDDPTSVATAEIIGQLGHLLAVTNEQLLSLGHQVDGLRKANRALLAQLYPPNEVYVAVRNGSVPAEGAAS